MSGIWSISSGYNTNARKISSKLTFNEGEKFKGRVVSRGSGNDVVIKLADGWQFIAEVEGSINYEELKLVDFEVDGFKDGKLKLKVVKENNQQSSEIDENFKELIEKEGFSKEDVAVLKKMLTYDIKLTKENVNEIKSLLHFNEKIQDNSEEIDKFIEKYIASKNIDISSKEGQAMKEVLTKFIAEFKTLNEEDILTFIENKIEFTENNIQSFNKLFKGDTSLEDILLDIGENLKKIGVDEENIEVLKKQIGDKLENNDIIKENKDVSSFLKAYRGNVSMDQKVNVLELLKALSVDQNDDNNTINSILKNDNLNINIEELKDLDKSVLDKLQDNKVMEKIKDMIGDNPLSEEKKNTQAAKLIESTNKFKLEELLSHETGKEVKLTSEEFKAISDLAKNSSNEAGSVNMSKTQQGNNEIKEPLNLAFKSEMLKEEKPSVVKSVNTNEENILTKDIKQDIKERFSDVKEIVRNIISKVDSSDGSYEKIMNMVKSNMNDVKVFNSISNEYYYLNVSVTTPNNEYPCKLIIKDNRKDGKKIDKMNVKMVLSVKTINLGEIDAYLTLKPQYVKVDLKCDDKFDMVLRKHRSALVDGLKSVGLISDVSVSAKERDVELSTCREFFNDVTISSIDITV